jgi:hypothetical protein
MAKVIRLVAPQRVARRRQPKAWRPEFLRVLFPEHDGEPDHAQALLDLRNAQRG